MQLNLKWAESQIKERAENGVPDEGSEASFAVTEWPSLLGILLAAQVAQRA